MSYSRLVLRDRADIIWALDNINDSSSVSNPINFFSNSASFYAASINTSATDVLKIPIVFGGGTALSLKSSSVAGLSIPLIDRFSEKYAYEEQSIEFWLRADQMPSQELTIMKKRNFDYVGLFLKDNYIIYRYGTASSYAEVSYGLAEINEPTHIILNYFSGGIQLIVNGISLTDDFTNGPPLPIDPTHTTNNYLDFYGNENYNIIVDCIAIYPFCLDENTGKIHYVYGLGKNIDEGIFFAQGGDYYNFSTNSTRKSHYTYWDYPDEWKIITYDNLRHRNEGIMPPAYPEPTVFSLDNNLNYSNNKISFTASSQKTIGSYIELRNLQNIIRNANDRFFTKFELNGQLPSNNDYQTLMAYGKDPLDELVAITLNNYSSSYYVVVTNKINSSSTSFYVQNISSSPSIYVGMSYNNGIGTYYYAQSGSALQSSSTVDVSGSVFARDPLSLYLPPDDDNFIRIASRGDYDTSVSLTELFDTKQFAGTFNKFMMARSDISASTFASLDSYNQSVYSFSYDSFRSRFKIYTYGQAEFVLHGSRMAEENSSGSFVISANRIEFGYPDVYSGSQVKFYATLYDYTSSVAVYPKTQLNKVNNLEWLNLIDLSSKYVQFNIEFFAEDSNRYPPIVKYFKSEFYPNSGSYVEILDNGGDRIKINSSSAKHIFLPEFDETPTVFVNNDSGVKIFRSTADIQFSPIPKTVDLTSLSSLVLNLNARKPQGLNLRQPQDSVVYNWIDLVSARTASNTSSALMPEYRIQSLNLLSNNIANGSESGSVVSNFNGAASVRSSTDYEIFGNRSIAIVPNGTSASSYMQFHSSDLMNYIFPGETYTAVGTVTLPKSFTSGSTIINPATIQAWVKNSGSYSSTVSASPSSNAAGSYSLSVTFSVPSTATEAFLRFYNGSRASADVVYWDNLGLYSGSTISGSPITWSYPYEIFDDRPTFKFNGASAFLSTSLSVSQPMTIYMVARGFGDNNTFIGHSGSAPAIYSSAGLYRMSAGTILNGASINNNFNILVGVFNNNSSSFFVNDSVVAGSVGTGSYSSAIRVGYRITPASVAQYLKGDVSSTMIFNQAHDRTTVELIKNYIKDIYNIS